jgi:hypothetical protein
VAAYNKFNAFVENLAEKVHNLGADTLTLALTAAANAPVATNSVLADLTQVSYTNLSSRVLTVSSSAQVSGTYSLVVSDLVLTASGSSGTRRRGRCTSFGCRRKASKGGSRSLASCRSWTRR